MSKKRILVYGLSNIFGGVESIVLSIINRMPDYYNFTIILPKGECSYSDKFHSSNICIVSMTAWGKNPFNFRKEMSEFLKHENFDYVWLNLSSLSNITLFKVLHKYTTAPIVIHSHTVAFEKQGGLKDFLILMLHYYCQKKYLKAASCLCACSKQAAIWMYGDKRNDIKIINNGIDADKFGYADADRMKCRAELNLGSKIVFLLMGRLCEVKNQSFALDVFNKIHNKCSNVHLLVVGEGDLRSELEHKCKVLSLSDNVSFLGFRNDVNFLLQGADVLLIPSLHEGLSLVSIEAQCAGLLCIASDGVPEEAKKTELLHFLPLQSGADSWADYILQLLPYERRTHKEEIEKAHFSIEYTAKEMKDIFI